MTEHPRYFLTAYGIALKHGFVGSEEEWLETLTAYGQALAAGYQGSYEEWLQKIADPVPALEVGETRTLEAGLPASVEITGTKERPVLNFGIPRGEGAEDALMTTGGRMSGVLSMGSNPLTDLADPEDDTDAVPKRYVDYQNSIATKAAEQAQDTADSGKKIAEAALARTGGAMTGHMTVLTPEENNHPATKKFVEDTVIKTHMTATVTLLASGWSASAPYTQAVSVSGLLVTDNSHVFPVYSDTLATAEIQAESWAMVSTATTSSGKLTFKCFADKPSADLTLIVEVNR